MPMENYTIAFLSATLTPLIMVLLGKLSSVKPLSAWEPSFEVLNKRNRVINGIACVLCMAGILVPMPLLELIPEELHMWLVGLGFGLMVILPVLFVFIVTIPFGYNRFMEFWRFYELKYNVGINGIMVVYVPLMILGAVSVFKIGNGI